MSFLGACGALARHGKGVRPHIQQGHEVVATIGVRHRQNYRLLDQIQPGTRVQGIEVGPNHHFHIRRRIFTDIGNLIHGAEAGFLLLSILVICLRVRSIVTSG